MGPLWGRQDPGGPHVGPMNIAILVYITISLPDEGTYVMYDWLRTTVNCNTKADIHDTHE